MVRKMKRNDSGVSFDYIKSRYPVAEKLKKEYHSLDEEEKAHITDWFLRGKMRASYFKWICLAEFILVFSLAIMCIGRFGKDEEVPIVLGEIVIATVIFVVLYSVFSHRYKRALSSVDFNCVQEVIFIECGLSRRRKSASDYYIYAWQWDEEKELFYKTMMYSDVYIKLSEGQVMYHPCGVAEYIP